MKVWHKKCYPQLLNIGYAGTLTLPNLKNFEAEPEKDPQPLPTPAGYFAPAKPVQGNGRGGINNTVQETATCSILYCNDCLASNHPNTYQHALTLLTKSRLVKITKITHYMRIFMEVYFN
jgi:hypothetical protein